MQCLINKGFCLHLLINFLSHLRHFTLNAIRSVFWNKSQSRNMFLNIHSTLNLFAKLRN